MLLPKTKLQKAFIVFGILTYALYAMVGDIFSRENAAQNMWLRPALIARSNSRMEVINQGTGPFVKLRRKIKIESDKSLIFGKPENQSYTFVVGVNDPKLFSAGSEALIGLRKGGIASLEIWPSDPRKRAVTRATVKILEICEESLKADICEPPKLDENFNAKFQICHNTTSAACEKLLDKTIMNSRTDEPDFPLVEYCAFYPDTFCFKLAEAIAILTRTKSDVYMGRFNQAIDHMQLFISRHRLPDFRAIILNKGSDQLARGILDQYLSEITGEKIDHFYASTGNNAKVQNQFTEKLVKSLRDNDFRARHIARALTEIRASVPAEVKAAFQSYKEKNPYYNYSR